MTLICLILLRIVVWFEREETFQREAGTFRCENDADPEENEPTLARKIGLSGGRAGGLGVGVWVDGCLLVDGRVDGE